MQRDLPPSPTPGFDEAYWRQLDLSMDRVKRRTRRQFLAAAGGLCGGTALLLGGLAWYNNPKAFFPTAKSNSCITADSSSNTALLSDEDPMVLKVCQINNSINFFVFHVAQQKGFFTSQGLVIPKPALLQVGSKVIDALEADHFDIGNGVITDAFSWARINSSARVIGSIMNGYIVDIVASQAFEQAANVSAASSLADKINALKGKAIGITGPGSGTQALLIYLFRLQGLDAAKDCKQVSLGSNSATALEALRSGRVDALSFYSPIGQAAVANGVGDLFISPVRGDVPGLRGDLHGVICTKQSTIDSKPQAIAKYIRAINQAEAFIQDNPVATKEILTDYLGLGPTIAEAVYAATSGALAASPLVSQKAYNIAGQFHLDAGIVSVIPDYTKLVASSTIYDALGIPCPSV